MTKLFHYKSPRNPAAKRTIARLREAYPDDRFSFRINNSFRWNITRRAPDGTSSYVAWCRLADIGTNKQVRP